MAAYYITGTPPQTSLSIDQLKIEIMPPLRNFLPQSTVVEINLISAQDLLSTRKPSSSKTQQTYVVARINRKQKLISRIDTTGDNNPTWNDKFIFTISGNTDFGSLNSTLVFEIYSVRRFRKDKLIGLVCVLLNDLIEKGSGCDHNFMAFHVRTSSGEPHGILNVGVMCLDGLFHDQDRPRFIGSSLAVDHRKLMGCY